MKNVKKSRPFKVIDQYFEFRLVQFVQAKSIYRDCSYECYHMLTPYGDYYKKILNNEVSFRALVGRVSEDIHKNRRPR